MRLPNLGDGPASHAVAGEVRRPRARDDTPVRAVPDDSRQRAWLPDQGSEIVRTERGDVARRKDGGAFRTVRFRMSPTDSVRPRTTRRSRLSATAACFSHRPSVRVRRRLRWRLLLNLAVDTKVRTATGSDGLYAVWGNYLRLLSRKGAVAGESLYLEAVSEVGGADTAAWLRNAVATPRWSRTEPSITSIGDACRNRRRGARPERSGRFRRL